jgi:hypothetical protein
MKKFLKELPLLLNGFSVGMLTFCDNLGDWKYMYFLLAGITFSWYGNLNNTNEK